MAAHFRIELLPLLAKPLQAALQCSNAAAAEAMLAVLQSEASTEQPEVLKDVLLLLANQVSRAAPVLQHGERFLVMLCHAPCEIRRLWEIC